MATIEQWTVLEKLLLTQAVYKYGEDNWFQIARNLKHHSLLDRPSDYFNQKTCSLQYYLMVEDLDSQKRVSLTQDMPVVVQLARELYSLRLEELQRAIADDEDKFLVLVSEIDDIRAGKWDNQLLGLPETAESSGLSSNADNSLESATPAVEDSLVQQEEEAIVENTNIEDEQRDVKKEDVPPVETIPEAIVENEPALELEAPVQDAIEPVEEPPVEAENPAEESIIEEEEPPVKEAIAPEQVIENNTPMKRQLDESDLVEEPELKRQKSEEAPVPIISQEEEPLMIDTSRTTYSTDVSQAATPSADIRDGTESIAESDSNAATPTSERKRMHDQRHKSWLKNINLLWREIANHKNGAMFMNPIKETIAPHYYDIVKRPMDMKTIKNRIRDGHINSTVEFERDVVLMLNNSLMYNKEGTEVYQMAREMLDDAQEQIKIFKTADTDTSASLHTRAASMAAAQRQKSVVE